LSSQTSSKIPMTTNTRIRTLWLKTLFSTAAANRPQAESAVADLYFAAGFQQPRHLLWFDSPLQASWAVALLLRPHSSIWEQLLVSTERTPSGREQLDRTRNNVCRQIGSANWDAAVTEAGLPLGHHWVQPDFSRGFPKMLPTEIQNTRIHLYEDVSRLFVAPSDTDDLDRAEQQLFSGARGVLVNLADWHETNSIRSTSFLADYSFSKMATDEAEAASKAVPPLGCCAVCRTLVAVCERGSFLRSAIRNTPRRALPFASCGRTGGGLPR